ncbi:MAG TPA: hypothetical protein VKR83_06200 [Ktedonobacteraceae bacterium]|nr:hypothetical protein [Ktedonobacteraceae bacterium]
MKFLTTFRHVPKRFAAIGILGVLALGALIPATAFAATPTTKPCASTDLQCFITAGDQFIAQRQTSLTNLGNRVAERLSQKLITSDQANALQADVSTNESGLASLKSKLDAETNAAAARQDDMNIFLQFRIYAVVLPRDYRRLYLDVAVNVDARLRGLSGQIKQAIQNAPPSEQGQLNTLYNDYIAQLTTAESQFDLAQSDFPALTPSNFNYNRSAYQSSLSSLTTAEKTIHTALHQAGSDAHQIATILKGK